MAFVAALAPASTQRLESKAGARVRPRDKGTSCSTTDPVTTARAADSAGSYGVPLLGDRFDLCTLGPAGDNDGQGDPRLAHGGNSRDGGCRAGVPGGRAVLAVDGCVADLRPRRAAEL